MILWHVSCSIFRFVKSPADSVRPEDHIVGADDPPRTRQSKSASPNTSPGKTATGIIEKEPYFRSLIENASDVITILEPNGIIRYQSPSIERVLGYKPEELIGCNAFEFVHPDDVARIQQIFAAIVQQPDRVDVDVFRFR